MKLVLAVFLGLLKSSVTFEYHEEELQMVLWSLHTITKVIESSDSTSLASVSLDYSSPNNTHNPTLLVNSHTIYKLISDLEAKNGALPFLNKLGKASPSILSRKLPSIIPPPHTQFHQLSEDTKEYPGDIIFTPYLAEILERSPIPNDPNPYETLLRDLYTYFLQRALFSTVESLDTHSLYYHRLDSAKKSTPEEKERARKAHQALLTTVYRSCHILTDMMEKHRKIITRFFSQDQTREMPILLSHKHINDIQTVCEKAGNALRIKPSLTVPVPLHEFSNKMANSLIPTYITYRYHKEDILHVLSHLHLLLSTHQKATLPHPPPFNKDPIPEEGFAQGMEEETLLSVPERKPESDAVLATRLELFSSQMEALKLSYYTITSAFRKKANASIQGLYKSLDGMFDIGNAMVMPSSMPSTCVLSLLPDGVRVGNPDVSEVRTAVQTLLYDFQKRVDKFSPSLSSQLTPLIDQVHSTLLPLITVPSPLSMQEWICGDVRSPFQSFFNAMLLSFSSLAQKVVSLDVETHFFPISDPYEGNGPLLYKDREDLINKRKRSSLERMVEDRFSKASHTFYQILESNVRHHSTVVSPYYTSALSVNSLSGLTSLHGLLMARLLRVAQKLPSLGSVSLSEKGEELVKGIMDFTKNSYSTRSITWVSLLRGIFQEGQARSEGEIAFGAGGENLRKRKEDRSIDHDISKAIAQKDSEKRPNSYERRYGRSSQGGPERRDSDERRDGYEGKEEGWRKKRVEELYGVKKSKNQLQTHK